ncbi:aminodeoxychorismate synthase component I [Pseudonocardia hispaniensis]|uniref:Aminodeoxychorismate synthase component I n=1 Tax=Pseudonocardia hispaniensis TaxID=904933 RepID=A0ABW1J817_9PSEU
MTGGRLQIVRTAPWARFDDLRAGTALRCAGPSRVLVAERPTEVLDVLAEVDRATRAGSWAYGYLAYEAASALDPTLPARAGPEGLPLAWFGLCAEPEPVTPIEPRAAGRYRAQPWRPGWTPQEHARAVDAVRAQIAAGETYQCNLTVRLHSRIDGDLTGLYADLALAQGGAHNVYLDLGRWVIASASPELFFEIAGNRLLMRPMKGTSRRGRSPAQDRALGEALRMSPKERAENVMIVDLMRNDAARIAETGSVSVRALCRLERYPTVLQLTSDVTARLRPETGLVDVLRALFPCGSITGAPKRRTMQLISELEPEPRGVYCGAIGLVGPPDAAVRARFNVAIRTVVADRASGAAVYGTGGGITWSSEPAAEHAELLAKAAILDHRTEQAELISRIG